MVVHLEMRLAGLTFHEKEILDAYQAAAADVEAASLNPADSATLIGEYAQRLETRK